eukprot:scaffold10099_cov137-Isochrysis_galbana.AAC.4
MARGGARGGRGRVSCCTGADPDRMRYSSIQMTELRPPRAVSPSWLVILFWPHLGLIGSKPREAHPAARSPGRMNWARSLSSKCWTVMAICVLGYLRQLGVWWD